MAGKPKAPFYLVVGLVVVGLVGFAAWRSWDVIAPKGNQDAPGTIDKGDLPQTATAESPDAQGITTVAEPTYVPAQRLAEVRGASDYKALEDNTVRMALNVWAGWSPVILANNGHQAGKIWKTPDGEEFKLELVLIDDPTTMLQTYVSGDVHLGWGTLDMLPLFMEQLVDPSGKPIDSRVMPRIYQQVDWSNGGDGIVVRDTIKQVSDLRGKKIALAQNSPSHYFALNMLVAGGVQPAEVEFVFTADAFQAAAAFNSDKSISACVSWAPDIYNLEKVKGNKMLVTTATANRLIADVWFARADFARDHGPKVEAIVRGIFDAVEDLKKQENKQQVAQLMSAFYNIPADETLGMLGDAYSTGWGDNYQFFMNENYLANFERVWNNAYSLYGTIRVVTKPRVPYDQVMDFTYIKKLKGEARYEKQKAPVAQFDPRVMTEQEIEKNTFLTATHYLHFFPNSSELRRKVSRPDGQGGETEELYDPNVDFVLDKIGERIGQFETSRIVIEGHADASMKGEVDEDLVTKLSQARAEAVRDALIKKFSLDPNRFRAIGKGWKEPADPTEPNNHAQNRRVEVQILPAEGV
ncbi:phosphate ABC transporter substrate-binding/OmpA family protein [Lignipirellula cremea]|uniref:Taurine-binding periplasmic protein n=1 Tax=Lignipirellula cremea TaxID=2528010 RepID=A0A518E013_9BACT|nr:phosphate ABC transporter substrate-binding/OmpA family protein [Lignipirellula cremea]QDU97428.1 Taurine-binding periplasmic protein precursor [Lignipirellula cremea]